MALTKQNDLTQILSLISRGALFVVNHSGGKDSQAMLIKIRELVPAAQILVIHAELRGVEWKGTLEHAQATSAGLEFRVARAVKSFLEMVTARGMWPSPGQRQCTSDLKRGPIEREIRHFLKEKNHAGLVVNCMGIRAQESTSRAEAVPFKKNERNSKAGREWYDWLPIHTFSLEDVLATVKSAGQELHWAYGKGMTRPSCMFCIMASKSDLQISARENPEAFQEILAKEKQIGATMFAEKGKGIPLDQYMLTAEQKKARAC